MERYFGCNDIIEVKEILIKLINQIQSQGRTPYKFLSYIMVYLYHSHIKENAQ